MPMSYLAEMHKLVERAKTLERLGKDTEALEIYLEVHEKFFPNTSDLYERPAVLLEKKKRFDEAIAMCEKAIKYIEEGKITGVRENFVKRIDRIKLRSDYGQKEAPTPKKAEAKPMDWSFMSKKSFQWTAVGSFFLIFGTAVLLIFLATKVNTDFEIDLSKLDLSQLQRSGYIETVEENEAYQKAFKEAQEKAKKPSDAPIITEEMRQHAMTVVSHVPEVKQANLITKDGLVAFALSVDPIMSKSDAQKAADTFVKALAASASNKYRYLEGPSGQNLGELYKYYSVMVAIGTNSKDAELFLLGSKKKADDRIQFTVPPKDLDLK